MKILIFYDSIDLGGQQTQLLNLVRIFREMGQDVSWAYFRGELLKDTITRSATLVQMECSLNKGDIRRRPWKIIGLAYEFRSILLREKPQLVLAGSGITAIIAGWTTHRSAITTLWLVGGLMREVMPTLAKFWKFIPKKYQIDGYLAWPAAFCELEKAGADPNKFHALPFAVDSARFKPQTEREVAETRKRFGFEPEHLVIGWIGRLSANMQIRDTIELFIRLHAQGVHQARLLVVGDGPAHQEFEQIIHTAGLGNAAVFTGWVDIDAVPAFINAMNIVPLLQSDPQGGSIMRETMACGRIALSVDGVSGTQASFMKKDATVLVSPENYIDCACAAVRLLGSDSELCRQMGRRARAYVEKELSFRRQAERILSVAKQLGART